MCRDAVIPVFESHVQLVVVVGGVLGRLQGPEEDDRAGLGELALDDVLNVSFGAREVDLCSEEEIAFLIVGADLDNLGVRLVDPG